MFERHAALGFSDLRPRPPRELLPSVTYARSETHDAPDRWTVVGNSEFGFSGKIGLGPTITLDATVNPDFSQVESDTFQVEVNQCFPTFFGEKRPFFMEGAGIFALAGSGNGDNSLRTAVHTRRIVDPIFGASSRQRWQVHLRHAVVGRRGGAGERVRSGRGRQSRL